MRYCFFLQRRFAIIGHAMARHIKEKYPDSEFCGMVQVRHNLDFLRSQTDIPYSSLLLEEDIHKEMANAQLDIDFLKDFEKTYGIPNLWPYLYIDRVIMNGQLLREYPYDVPLLSHEEMLKRLQVTARAILFFLDEEKPDVVVTSVVGSVGSMLLYHIAKKKGIKTIQIEFARIGTRIVLTEDYRTFTGVKKAYDAIRSGRHPSKKKDAISFLENFRSAPGHYDEKAVPGFYDRVGRGANLEFFNFAHLSKSIPWYFRTLVKDIKRRKGADYMDIMIWWTVWDKLKRKARGLIGYSDMYSKPDFSNPYAYYPMHIDPEIATMLYAPYYVNQLELIRAIARSLPVGMPLYVKEHPGMVGFRTRAFYREMLKTPNVKLISPSVSGLDLARDAALTVTMTSTNAWESMLLKKPIITFGDVFFNDIPGVERCRGFEELPHLVQKQLFHWEHDEEALVDYISAILEESVDCDFSELWNRGATVDEIYANESMRNLSLLLAKAVK